MKFSNHLRFYSFVLNKQAIIKNILNDFLINDGMKKVFCKTFADLYFSKVFWIHIHILGLVFLKWLKKITFEIWEKSCLNITRVS